MTLLPQNILKMMSAQDRASLGKEGELNADIEKRVEAKTEKELQGMIARYLRLHNIWFNQDAMHKRRMGTKGATDFIFAYRGIPCGVEAKTATGKCSPDQIAAHEQMTANGWRIIIARSVKDVQDLIRKIDSEHTLKT